ncbi:hypothetical protein B0H11DRAFT_2240685 [Mycena galericulata]|nr:hypothetical protein B0H11DRAFT_2240685 [Mycena galericulata]
MSSDPWPINLGALQGVQTHLLVLAGETFFYGTTSDLATSYDAELNVPGAYAVIFGFYIHIIRTRGIFNNRFLTVATISLFILCTAHCALLWADIIFYDAMWEADLKSDIVSWEPSSVPSSVSIYTALNRAANTVYITSNVIADSIFIFRCYAIWNFRRTVIILPTILTFIVGFLGYASVAESLQPLDTEIIIALPESAEAALAFYFNISMATSVFTTFILMALSAGRIWWLARKSQQIMGRRVTSKYYTVCAMILESGALYCVGAIPFICVAFASFFGLVQTDITTSGAILGQLVGIAPTIIAGDEHGKVESDAAANEEYITEDCNKGGKVFISIINVTMSLIEAWTATGALRS